MDNITYSTHDFYYELPPELIAQTPCEKRENARLLVANFRNKTLEHKHFYDICDYLKAGDVLVINDSKVMPARIYGKKVKMTDTPEEGSNVEVVLIRQKELDLWECIVRPGKRLKEGALIDFSSILKGKIEKIEDDGNRLIRFEYDRTKYENIFNVLDKIGKMPLPPYITEELKDNDLYQTVYAREIGSAAAPTAGLHFTEELLAKIKNMGVLVAPVMLHVGLGTFRPVKADNIKDHKMHSEYFVMSEESADIINNVRKNGGRVVSVGTTSTRVLESTVDDNGTVHAFAGETDIFIYPGYKFKCVDALITNFHLPESTLVMLVSAFAGREFILDAYKTAVKEKYRFFSFGDAMLIV